MLWAVETQRMPSGLPAQTIAFTTDSARWRTRDETEPGDRIWTEGPGPTCWPEYGQASSSDAPAAGRRVPGAVHSLWAMPARHAICDARPRAQTEASQYVLTVTSPAGTLPSRLRPLRRRRRRHRDRGHDLMAARPGRSGPHPGHRPRPRLHSLGRHHHPLADRRRRQKMPAR